LQQGRRGGTIAAMSARPIRLAVRGLILRRNRLLLVNAWPGEESDLWCAPGGGAEPGQSLPDNLAREIHEETGLRVAVGAPALVNEFHDPAGGFHQVDIYFRCRIVSGDPHGAWRDPEGVVNRRRWASREEMAGLRFKPDSLPAAAWAEPGAPGYDPLEPILR
jgi:8-oxo-dGTP pyrophosphatase MutT (NUDIX family)